MPYFKPDPFPFTRTDTLFTELAKRAEEISGTIAVVIPTDGHSDGVTPLGHKAIKVAAQQLANNQRVEVVAIAGAEPGTLEELRRDLAPLGKKLKFVRLTIEDAQRLDLFPVRGAK